MIKKILSFFKGREYFFVEIIVKNMYFCYLHTKKERVY